MLIGRESCRGVGKLFYCCNGQTFGSHCPLLPANKKVQEHQEGVGELQQVFFYLNKCC